MMRGALLCGVIGLMCVIGCHQTNEVVEVQQPRISMTVSNLPPLAAGEGHYHLWAKFLIFSKSEGNDSPQHDSTAASLGEFNVAGDGQSPVALDGSPMQFVIPADQNPQLIDDLIVAIEEDEPGVAKTHHNQPGPTFLGGKVAGDAALGVADLGIAYPHALGSTFSNVTGKYTITAPTSPVDSNSGVWFIEQQGTTTSVGLRNLPVLPAGWRYEGWVGRTLGVVPGGLVTTYYSTGKFLRADSADFDAAGVGRGSGPGYDFPGQDFITGAGGTPVTPNLTDGTYSFALTVEPFPDTSPQPFFLKILSTPLTSPPRPQGQALSMNTATVSSFPRARVTIVRSGY